MKLRRNFNKGFTLVELLVVISIVIVLVAMSIPAMTSQMKQRRLKAAANAVQMAFLETRARAIAQREPQYLVFFTTQTTYALLDKNGAAAKDKNDAAITVNGAQGTIYSYDSNESTSTRDDDYVQAGDPVTLPEFITYEKIGEMSTTDTSKNYNFQYSFFSDGMVQVSTSSAGYSGTLGDQDSTQASPKWDVIFSQSGEAIKCYLDIVPITGKITFLVD